MIGREHAYLLRSGETVSLGDVEGHVVHVEKTDDRVRLLISVVVPALHPVEIAGDPFEDLVDELEAWGGA